MYSGFATRKDETNYNQLLTKLLALMQHQCLQLMHWNPPNPQTKRNYARILTRMMHYEEHKYLPPKFAHGLAPLAEEVGVGKHARIPEVRDEEENEGQSQEKIGSTAYSQPKLTVQPKEKMQIFTHRRLKTQQNSRQGKSRPATSTQHRRTTTQMSGRGIKVKHDQEYRQSFYQMHERKLKRMNQRYAQKMHSLHFGREEGRKVERQTVQTPKNRNSSFKSSKFDFQSEKVDHTRWEESSNEGNYEFSRPRGHGWELSET